ncbi:LLM class flavin-dependent oxidoreductase [Saccharothrix longispora]|uniref:Alkanesulfonate monooxygenase SsuD/methylene tetrahydromethanopterin reductase-like flavin-dependent oxidoreductase (Luciferase family) n=1 Tax=Saccharothrix longispora TaxID=33920 RepID=A0ABU1PQB9_9PSEU|nr:LLM class flavin-dependent oxidoreductase [Saccharothrix longispora]MDR6592834.1 alkanesulfonate monooxygenase SsuD/methylene tetrahydromethanopterin reductase-like flavin-dependent oxidoreductase (luciferase family) [Saccharothrix longispora]
MGRSGSVGVMLPRDLAPAAVLPFARRADELGFDELWVVEDLGFRGGVAQAAAVLAVTPRIRVGIGLLPAGARNAAFAAMEAATLAQLFPGRVDIGVGHGMPAWMRSVGQWPASPLTLLEEHVRAVTALVRGEAAERGRYVSLDPSVRLEPACVPDVPPLVLAGVRGPRSLAVSGRVADGTVLAEPVTPEYARAALAQVDARRPHRLVAYNATSVHPDRAAAVEAVRPGLAWIGEPDWAPHLAPLPFAEEFAALRRECGDRDEFARRLPEEWVRQLSVVGTADDARARLAELFDAGVDSVVLILADADPADGLERLAAVL